MGVHALPSPCVSLCKDIENTGRSVSFFPLCLGWVKPGKQSPRGTRTKTRRRGPCPRSRS